jgi:hypothetical protein
VNSGHPRAAGHPVALREQDVELVAGAAPAVRSRPRADHVVDRFHDRVLGQQMLSVRAGHRGAQPPPAERGATVCMTSKPSNIGWPR